MAYERSLAIERRLDEVLVLIQTGQFSTSDIARELGVSVPTISRDITALRKRGYEIRAERRARGWRYVLESESGMVASSHARRRMVVA